MFDAAHAALFALRIEQVATPIKTPGRLGAQFGRRVVLGGHLADVHGESINKVQRLRQLAGYSGDPVGFSDAAWAVEQAEAFVAAVRARFIP